MTEQAMAVPDKEEISLAELRQRLPVLKAKGDLVREFQKEVLREGIDYGPIPGTGKRDVLKKPGAESLLAWHNFDTPDDEIVREEHDWATGFHYYAVRMTVRSQKGKTYSMTRACSTYEKKYRYDKYGTERPLADLNSQADNMLAMANKRALVGVTRLATATSGLFDEEYDGDDEEGADEGIRVPFGRDKGKLVSELTVTKDVSWLADAIAKSIADPEKKKYKAANERLHAALVARLAELNAPVAAPTRDKEVRQPSDTPHGDDASPAAAGATENWHKKFRDEMAARMASHDDGGKVYVRLLADAGYRDLDDIASREKAVAFYQEYLKRTGKQGSLV